MSWEEVTIGSCRLIRGDAREVVPTLGALAAVVTDPPYGIGYRHKVLGGIVGDDQAFDPQPFLVGQQHIFWGAHHYSSRLPDASRWLLWVKHDPGLFGKRAHAPFDLAWTDLTGSGRAYKHIWDASIRQGEWFGKPNCHPHQKPTELMGWCLSFLAPASAPTLDPFMGSGTTGVACVQRGRSFIGIEIDPDYFAIACQRIEAAYAQPDLFVPPPTPPLQQRLLQEAQP